MVSIRIDQNTVEAYLKQYKKVEVEVNSEKWGRNFCLGGIQFNQFLQWVGATGNNTTNSAILGQLNAQLKNIKNELSALDGDQTTAATKSKLNHIIHARRVLGLELKIILSLRKQIASARESKPLQKLDDAIQQMARSNKENLLLAQVKLIEVDRVEPRFPMERSAEPTVLDLLDKAREIVNQATEALAHEEAEAQLASKQRYDLLHEAQAAIEELEGAQILAEIPSKEVEGAISLLKIKLQPALDQAAQEELAEVVKLGGREELLIDAPRVVLARHGVRNELALLAADVTQGFAAITASQGRFERTDYTKMAQGLNQAVRNTPRTGQIFTRSMAAPMVEALRGSIKSIKERAGRDGTKVRLSNLPGGWNGVTAQLLGKLGGILEKMERVEWQVDVTEATYSSAVKSEADQALDALKSIKSKTPFEMRKQVVASAKKHLAAAKARWSECVVHKYNPPEIGETIARVMGAIRAAEASEKVVGKLMQKAGAIKTGLAQHKSALLEVAGKDARYPNDTIQLARLGVRDQLTGLHAQIVAGFDAIHVRGAKLIGKWDHKWVARELNQAIANTPKEFGESFTIEDAKAMSAALDQAIQALEDKAGTEIVHGMIRPRINEKKLPPESRELYHKLLNVQFALKTVEERRVSSKSQYRQAVADQVEQVRVGIKGSLDLPPVEAQTLMIRAKQDLAIARNLLEESNFLLPEQEIAIAQAEKAIIDASQAIIVQQARMTILSGQALALSKEIEGLLKIAETAPNRSELLQQAEAKLIQAEAKLIQAEVLIKKAPYSTNFNHSRIGVSRAAEKLNEFRERHAAKSEFDRTGLEAIVGEGVGEIHSIVVFNGGRAAIRDQLSKIGPKITEAFNAIPSGWISGPTFSDVGDHLNEAVRYTSQQHGLSREQIRPIRTTLEAAFKAIDDKYPLGKDGQPTKAYPIPTVTGVRRDLKHVLEQLNTLEKNENIAEATIKAGELGDRICGNLREFAGKTPFQIRKDLSVAKNMLAQAKKRLKDAEGGVHHQEAQASIDKAEAAIKAAEAHVVQKVKDLKAATKTLLDLVWKEGSHYRSDVHNAFNRGFRRDVVTMDTLSQSKAEGERVVISEAKLVRELLAKAYNHAILKELGGMPGGIRGQSDELLRMCRTFEV